MDNYSKELENYFQNLELVDYGHLEEVTFDLPEVYFEKLILDPCYEVKTFSNWQEALSNLMETADPKTLKQTSDIAKKVLERIPAQSKTSSKEKLLRANLETLENLGS